jgi:probable rRNA maturation factor
VTRPRLLLTARVRTLPRPAPDLARRLGAALRRITCRPVSVSLVILDDSAIRTLNRRFLGHDYATDVLSFPLTEGPPPRGGGAGFHPRPDVPARRVSAVIPFGEVYLSVTTAVREAKARGIDPAEELLRYAIHGMLHLFGHDDRRPADRRRMWARQEALVRSTQTAEARRTRSGKKGTTDEHG